MTPQAPAQPVLTRPTDAADASADPDAALRQAVGLLRRQLEALSHLHELADRQRALIDAGDPAQLFQLLRSRWRWIEVIRRASAQLHPLQDHFVSGTGGANASIGVGDWPVRAEAASLHRQVGERLDALSRRDEEDCRSLSMAKRAVEQERTKLAASHAAASAYGRRPAAAVPAAPRFTDRTG